MDTFFCPIGVRIIMDSLIKHTLSGLLYTSIAAMKPLRMNIQIKDTPQF